MKLADCRAAYQELSGKASELSRTLSLSGIAIIWVLKSDTVDGPKIPTELFTPGLFLVLSLALDLLHYVTGALAWGAIGRIKELRGTTEDEDFLAPRWANWPGNLMFCAKLISVGVAYYFLLLFLFGHLATSAAPHPAALFPPAATPTSPEPSVASSASAFFGDLSKFEVIVSAVALITGAWTFYREVLARPRITVYLTKSVGLVSALDPEHPSRMRIAGTFVNRRPRLGVVTDIVVEVRSRESGAHVYEWIRNVDSTPADTFMITTSAAEPVAVPGGTSAAFHCELEHLGREDDHWWALDGPYEVTMRAWCRRTRPRPHDIEARFRFLLNDVTQMILDDGPSRIIVVPILRL